MSYRMNLFFRMLCILSRS